MTQKIGIIWCERIYRPLEVNEDWASVDWTLSKIYMWVFKRNKQFLAQYPEIIYYQFLFLKATVAVSFNWKSYITLYVWIWLERKQFAFNACHFVPGYVDTCSLFPGFMPRFSLISFWGVDTCCSWELNHALAMSWTVQIVML